VKKLILSAFAFILAGTGIAVRVARSQTPASAAAGPQFTADNKLVFPKDYREWVFLSSGLGMNYNTPGAAAANNPNFTNVFVNPAAYKAFQQTGRWPEQTMFVLEIRNSTSEGSINKGGRFQQDIAAIESEVKDSKRFPDGKWAFFGFGKETAPTAMLAKTQSCYTCHSQNGAVDNTFVQFYPDLLTIAKAKGTVKQ
jgi:hypothetical protein